MGIATSNYCCLGREHEDDGAVPLLGPDGKWLPAVFGASVVVSTPSDVMSQKKFQKLAKDNVRLVELVRAAVRRHRDEPKDGNESLGGLVPFTRMPSHEERTLRSYMKKMRLARMASAASIDTSDVVLIRLRRSQLRWMRVLDNSLDRSQGEPEKWLRSQKPQKPKSCNA